MDPICRVLDANPVGHGDRSRAFSHGRHAGSARRPFRPGEGRDVETSFISISGESWARPGRHSNSGVTELLVYDKSVLLRVPMAAMSSASRGGR
ncbi:hypothetical protein VFPBJ_02768 [Purpureocillium lilacinum]|uniref:Uncharacterized protein n=1 Tax=Purpureocillium lilacinum TaxID=33203 RepID=A0A179H348_PURLI|nr:hypothetical protein VFPBJ_02768 [Purpureocillium lilacinum]